MPVQKHIFQDIDADLAHIESLVDLVWGLVKNQWQSVMLALQTREPVLAADTASREDSIDDLSREIERGTVRFLALRQPLAGDLRFIIAALHISIELERIGDYGANIIKRSALTRPGADAADVDSVPKMAGMVLQMLDDLYQDYKGKSLSLSEGVIARDNELSALYEQVFEDLRAQMARDRDLIETCTELLFIARNIERSGAHAKNIAKHLYCLSTGVAFKERQGNEPA
jgi:phosphate transport system protein